jgi:hypothetical protein
VSDKIKALGGEHWGCEWQSRFDTLNQDPQYRALVGTVMDAIAELVVYTRKAKTPASFVFQPCHGHDAREGLVVIGYSGIEEPSHH